MTDLLVIKEYLKNFYSKYEIYVRPAWKFLLAFVTLVVINSQLGYMSRIDNMAIVLIVALMCSFLPSGCIMLFSALFITLHLYALSMECAMVAIILIFVMFLLYFRFTPKESIVLVFTPLTFVFKIPYVMPLAMGLIGTPASAISVGCGTILYYFLDFVKENDATINVLDDDLTTRFRFLIDGLVDNKEMIVTVAAFMITLIVVYIIRRMSIDHSWTIAMIAGILVTVVMLLVGDLIYDTNVSILAVLLGGAASVLLAKVLQFFLFGVDYSRTERVQFEDDEYYYYVKAVPKLSVATPTKTVKRINTQKNQNVSTKTPPQTVNTVGSDRPVRKVNTIHTAGTRPVPGGNGDMQRRTTAPTRNSAEMRSTRTPSASGERRYPVRDIEDIEL